MPDDEKTEPTQTAAEGTTTEGGQTTAEGGQVAIHPLAEGGVRFNEVYGEMKAAKAKAEMLERQLADATAARSQPVAPATYTAAQLQAMVDAGKVTPMAAADQLSWQRAEESRVKGQQDAEHRQMTQEAQADIDRYLVAKPDALGDPRVLTAARQLMRETGWRETDPRLARRALREVYGAPDRIEAAQRQQESSRQAGAGGPVEGRAGGGTASAAQAGNDPLKGAPQYLTEFWDQMNYSREQRVKEFKVYKPTKAFALRQGREAK
jgi:hypothetical protein